MTEIDDAAGYQNLLQDLIREKIPVGPMEMFLVESMTLDMVRTRRARMLEAQFVTAVLHPPVDLLPELTLCDPGTPAPIDASSAQKLVNFQRYESVFVARFLRALHELERLQRMRVGEKLPAPAALDVTIHTEDSPNAPSVPTT